jgi:hypothetical protein
MMVWRLLDRPPELVIGPAKGRTRWRAMTAEHMGEGRNPLFPAHTFYDRNMTVMKAA